ncbi:helix-turn-helix domain-containing protein [Brevundimonas sp.]|uniref:helix-turn-helix domain-containing protein n=1 Tax=Brevundimonas sp. TaxID=1871086 RepID=UPI002ED785F1
MKLLDIGEVADRSGLPASTLRFYEGKGLIASVGRRGLRRLFELEVLDRLSLIALGRLASFSLDEIGAMLGAEAAPQIDRARLADKADELNQTIQRLTALRNALRHAAECPAPSHMECPTFNRLRQAAVARGRETRPPAKRAASRGSGS